MTRATTPPASAASRALWFTGLGLVTLGAELLRFHQLDREPFWFDEAYTALTVQHSVTGILERLRNEGNAPLYYLIMLFWRELFGDGVYAFRSFSALLGTLAIPLVFFVGSHMFSRPAGLTAALLAAVTPLHIHYSQEARMYPLVTLLALLALYALHRLMVAPSLQAALGFAAVALIGLYTQYYFLFLLPVAAAALWSDDRKRSLRFTALALALVALGFAPWLPSFVAQASNPSSDWIGGFWHDRSLLHAVPWSLQVLGPAAAYPGWSTFKFGSSPVAGVLSLALAVVVLGAAAVQLAATPRNESSHKEYERRSLALSLACVLVPLGLACVASLVRRPIYVVARYDLIAWGAYCILAGAVLSRLAKPLRAGVLALWLGLAAYTLGPYLTTERPKRHYIEMGDKIAAVLLERARPGETVVFTTATRTMAQYYLRHDLDRFRLVSFPLGTDDHLGWIDTAVQTNQEVAGDETERFLAWLLDRGEEPLALWIVAPRSPGTAPLLAGLARHGYVEAPERSLGTALLCLERPNRSSSREPSRP